MPQVAQGVGKKRTPQLAFDPAPGNDVYEPEEIVTQCVAKVWVFLSQNFKLKFYFYPGRRVQMQTSHLRRVS